MNAREEELVARALLADQAQIDVYLHDRRWAELAALVARPRRGGEQFQSHAAGVLRALKKQFQAAGVPAWLRDAPLLWRGERLVCVPALGVDAREQAPPGAPQWRPRWAG